MVSAEEIRRQLEEVTEPPRRPSRFGNGSVAFDCTSGRIRDSVEVGRSAFQRQMLGPVMIASTRKKRPLSGPTFSKRLRWRESEESDLTPLWGQERTEWESITIESAVHQTGTAS